VISLQIQVDLAELWSNVIQGKDRQLWCDGLKVAVVEFFSAKQTKSWCIEKDSGELKKLRR